MPILIFLLILSILVLVHELGHFIAAKKNGVLVEEFGFGLPPRIFGIKRGETLYSLNLLPFGGFVKVYGEEYAEDQIKIDKNLKKRAFIYKKPAVKTLILIAGVLMNFILGVVVFYILLGTNGFRSEPLPLYNNYDFRFGKQESKVIVANVVKGSPAEKAGVQVEDIIVRFRKDNKPWVNINSADQLIKLTNQANGQNIDIDLNNAKNGQRKIVSVIPSFDKKVGRAIIGVNLIKVVDLYYQTPTQKLFSGFMHSYNVMAYNLNTLKSFIASAFKEKSWGPVAHTVSGPVGIFAVVSDIVKGSGNKLVVNLANLVALLSLSLALFNILPFPALDGGRLVFIVYEVISGKRTNAKIERYLNLVGIIILLSLVVLISINDIIKFYK